ncbi:NaeI family type II restriction endonuclease [Streptomyces sp. TRM 70351]|uniref:NaeI family type II restriction endonuclease n=1 Tax=Streptomyces sp. TRM 70351 TaxID=3116552 RepID=UPI002E7C1D71|nr:NaeI family type II restriction endonuclease [Streptomyces sp. TRM 70351]MEE1929776.1 NaeI family type II restriction endonuclease [Streptomyces sp. TRM 70351]
MAEDGSEDATLFTTDATAAARIAAGQLPDPELAAVETQLRQLDPEGTRFGAVLRDTIDQLLNGEVTGRYDWKTLYKTEKTHAGTLVEINVQREFGFADGALMDYRIAGVEVDCKYSQQFGGWMIPPEAVGHVCLLLWADDYKSRWSAGLLRIRREWLNHGNNRDLKLTVKAAHRSEIRWLWKDSELPQNVLLHMDPGDRSAVFAPSSGQARVNELFRRAQNRRIGRNVVRTVAQQKDYMKRVRGNGGARTALRQEGILIFGDYASHRDAAAALNIAVPREGEFVSVRVVQAAQEQRNQPHVTLDGRSWVRAEPDAPVERAPELPKHTR